MSWVGELFEALSKFEVPSKFRNEEWVSHVLVRLVRSKGEHTNAIANAHARTRSREAGPDQDNKQRHRASCPAAARTTPHRTGPRPMPCAVPRIDAPAPPVRIRSTILF